MTKEQLSELEYPYTNHDNFDQVFDKRAAFIKGLEIVEEFAKWCDSTPYRFSSMLTIQALELFLIEKYSE